jgi:hypothetical protein
MRPASLFLLASQQGAVRHSPCQLKTDFFSSLLGRSATRAHSKGRSQVAEERIRWFCKSCDEWKLTPFAISGQHAVVRCERGHEQLVTPQKPADDVLTGSEPE